MIWTSSEYDLTSSALPDLTCMILNLSPIVKPFGSDDIADVAVMGFRVLIEAEEKQSKHALTLTMATVIAIEAAHLAALSFQCFNSFCKLLNLWHVDINEKKSQ